MHSLTIKIKQYLKEHADSERALGAQTFFKEGFKTYGARKPEMEKFIKQTIRDQFDPLPFEERMIIAEELLKSRMYEEAQAANLLLERQGKNFNKETLDTFSRWIDSYIENWGTGDSFCIRVVFQIFVYHRELVRELFNWADSNNRWMRRAACATLSKLSRKGDFLSEVLAMAEKLLEDEDDLVQKGAGWMLKEASRTKSHEVINFIDKNHEKMPRLVLRLAIEKMDKKTRKEILSKY